MPEIDLDPTADGSTIQWAPVDFPPNWECVLDAAREPDAPDTSTHIITDGTDGLVDEYLMDTVADVEQLTSVTLWAYAIGPLGFLDQNIHAQLYLGGAWLDIQDLNPPDSWSWCHVTYDGSWTQDDLDSLQVRVTAHDPDMGSEIAIAALYCRAVYTEPEPPPPPPEKERTPLRPPGMRSPPKITTSMLISRISGPFGSSSGRYRFNTRKGRRIHISKRKPATVVGLQDGPHAYAAYCWHLVDLAFRCLDKRRKIEWGKCTYRTPNKARSNIDEFRRHNIPRAFMGWPLLATPPNRFKSRLAHLPTHKSSNSICDNANIILPIEGETKDGTPFAPHIGDLPIPCFDWPPCWPKDCMALYSHCYQGCVLTKFPIRGNVPHHVEVTWECQKLLYPYGHNPDTCEPYLKWVHEPPWHYVTFIWKQFLHDDPPHDILVRAGDLYCRTKYFEGVELPQHPGYAFKLYVAQSLLGTTSVGWYTKPNLDGCAQGDYILFKHEGADFDWPRHVFLAPYKFTISPCLECPPPAEADPQLPFLICHLPHKGQSGKVCHARGKNSWWASGFNKWYTLHGCEHGYVTAIACSTFGDYPGHWHLGVSYAEGRHANYHQPAKCQARVPTGAFYLDHPDQFPDMPNFVIIEATDRKGANWDYPDPPKDYMHWLYLLAALVGGYITIVQYEHMSHHEPFGVNMSIAPSLRHIVRDVWLWLTHVVDMTPCMPPRLIVNTPEAMRMHDILTQAIQDGKFPGLGGF